MNWEAVGVIIAAIGLVGSFIAFMIHSFNNKISKLEIYFEKKFSEFDKRFLSMEVHFDNQIKEIKNEIKEIKNEMKEIKSELRSIDQRLSHFEGAFEERGRWESRKTGTLE
jgi:chromosome segregation ATPase